MFYPHTIKGKVNLRLDLIANPPVPPTDYYDTLLLNGSTQDISLGADSSLALVDDFLYNAWVYPTSFSSNKYIFSRYNLTGTNRALLIRGLSGSGFLSAVTSSDGNSSSSHPTTIAIPLSVWSMVSARMTGGALWLSINAGTEQGFSIDDLNVGSAETFIGSFQGAGEEWTGNIIDTLIIGGLTTDIRADLYNLGVPKQPEGYDSAITDLYVCALPLNDGVVDPYVDRSANGNDGTASGSPIFTVPQIEFDIS